MFPSAVVILPSRVVILPSAVTNLVSSLVILPALIVIIFALITKRTLEALFLGTIATYVVIYGSSFAPMWSEAFFKAAGDADNQWVLIVCGLFT